MIKSLMNKLLIIQIGTLGCDHRKLKAFLSSFLILNSFKLTIKATSCWELDELVL